MLNTFGIVVITQGTKVLNSTCKMEFMRNYCLDINNLELFQLI